VPYLSASYVVFHYKEVLYQVHASLPLVTFAIYLVRQIQVLVFNTVNATFAAHCNTEVHKFN